VTVAGDAVIGQVQVLGTRVQEIAGSSAGGS
jgi:hypothetical protein